MGENAQNRGRTQHRAISVEGKSRSRSRPGSLAGILEESDVSCKCVISCHFSFVVAPVFPGEVPLSGVFEVPDQHCSSRVHE